MAKELLGAEEPRGRDTRRPSLKAVVAGSVTPAKTPSSLIRTCSLAM